MTIPELTDIAAMFDLRSKVALLVAHPDDESLGAGLLLQRIDGAHIIYCANGPSWWPPYWLWRGPPTDLAKSRRYEAETAIRRSGKLHHIHWLNLLDGWLVTHLQDAYRQLSTLFAKVRPNVVVTHAYESGHEDHDACSFLAYQLSLTFMTENWEIPLYHRSEPGGAVVRQTFLDGSPGEEIVPPLSTRELETKRSMLEAHASQSKIIQHFNPSVEIYRKQPSYDYTQRPPKARPSQMLGFSPQRAVKAFGSWKKPV